MFYNVLICNVLIYTNKVGLLNCLVAMVPGAVCKQSFETGAKRAFR